MVIDSYREETLGLVLSDDVLVEMCLDFHGLRHLLQAGLALLRLVPIQPVLLLHYAVSLLSTVLTDIAVDTSNEKPYLILCPATETTCFPCHYCFLINTLSIIPYALASSAVIQ